MHVASVIINRKSLNTLDYLVPEDLKLTIGELVEIPFRSTKAIGVITEIKHNSDIAYNKLKTIHSKLEIPPFKAELLEFITKFAKYYLEPLGDVLKLFLPTINYNFHKIKFSEPKSFQYHLAQLTFDQQIAYENITAINQKIPFSVSFLDGITGSGKTEVYFHLISDILQKNTEGQILILLPEIVLTSQLIQRFYERFGCSPVCWHSDFTIKQRSQLWHDIVTGKERVIIGARSSLCLPFPNLKLIIIDEEHDASFKQEEGVVYNARDMAILKANIEQIPVILSSATPSVETYYNVISKKYNHVTLPTRFGKATLPIVSIVDLREHGLERNSYISEILRKEIIAALANKQQVLLFLNRRGYAPLTLCLKCGFRYICPNCSSWLVEHKYQDKLECHHCGYKRRKPSNCDNCKEQHSLTACGPGIERIEEEIKTIFPKVSVAVITKDTTGKTSQVKDLISRITNKEIDIIIGTQIISKGHHFPGINLVGVIDADLGLTGGELRAAERTYQLLAQVSGRAGRSSTDSKVIIQTYYPENATFITMREYKRDQFLQHELESRELALMPPFSRLATVILSAQNEEKLQKFAQQLAKNIPRTSHVTVLGPAKSFIYRLKKQFRLRFMVKCSKNIKIQHYINHWIESVKTPSSVRVKVDIDPYSLF